MNTPTPINDEQLVAIELAPRSGPFHWLEGKEGFVWLFCAGLLLLTGVLKSINLVIVLAYLLIALWVLNLVLARRSLRNLLAKRSALPTIIAGQPAAWTIEIQSPPANAYWTLEEHAGDAYTAWLIPPRASHCHVRMTALFPHRGRVPLAALQASSGFPFGLCRRHIELLPPGELIVLPIPARVDVAMLQAWLLRQQQGRDEERRRVRRVVDREAELHGLRDYRPGDPVRRIHWKATARRGRTMVREYEDSLPPRLTLFVDLWLPREATDADRQRSEHAISLAAGVCIEWRREAAGRLALVVCAQKSSVIDGPAGPTLTAQMWETLALAEGTTEAEPLPLLQQLTQAALTAPILVVSTRTPSPIATTVMQFVNHSVGSVVVSKQEPWFRLP